MAMYSFEGGFLGRMEECELNQESLTPAYSDNIVLGLKETPLHHDHSTADNHFPSNVPGHRVGNTSSSKRFGADFMEVNELSAAVLKYINRVLMEDDLEENALMIHDSTLCVAEKSFCDALNNKHPPPPNQQLHQDASISCSCNSSGSLSNSLPEADTVGNFCKSSLVQNSCVNQPFPLSSSCDSVDRLMVMESLTNEPLGGQCNVQFKEQTEEKGRESLHQDDSDFEEGRRNKQLATYSEVSLLDEKFDKLLLFSGEKDESASHSFVEVLPNWGKSCTSKAVSKREAIDMRNLLIQCMKSVASNDYKAADKLLKQLRQHSSPSGNASQRLVHCFTNGLEARLAGTGSLVYRLLATKNMSTSDSLKANELFVSTVPYIKTSNYLAMETILEVTGEARSIHIIQFGIKHGLEFPSLIQRLSARPGGPPKLRITGIDFPLPGFRPAARVEKTGRRLADCCKRYNVPFEYIAIAKKWETLCLDDLKTEKDEVLVVYCLFKLQSLLDYTILEELPRDSVLNLIRRISPRIFIHGVMNAAHSSPFFASRFKDALFFYSTTFDMLEACLQRDNKERMVFETEIIGMSVVNVIACEGLERIERPETYKQWQVRTLRAGFSQLPLNQEIIKKVKAEVKSRYHKNFFVDEASQWMVQGWKGRVLVALSCWKPA